MTSPNELERKQRGAFLQRDHPSLIGSSRTVGPSSAKSREFWVGPFSRLHTPETAPNLGPNINFEFGDVSGDISELPCGFLLFVRSGLDDFLEGHVWGRRTVSSGARDRPVVRAPQEWKDPALVESRSDFEALARKLPELIERWQCAYFADKRDGYQARGCARWRGAGRICHGEHWAPGLEPAGQRSR